MQQDWPKTRVICVPERGQGYRLDRLLSAWFKDWSRSELVKGIKQGLVTDDNGRAMRPSQSVKAGQLLHIAIPGLAPSSPPPPFPRVVLDEAGVVMIDKPAGMVVHPSGSRFVWSVIALARMKWPDCDMDLCHRLDRDTSGILVLTKDKAVNHAIKTAFKQNQVRKEYEAICKGTLPNDEVVCTQPMGPREGEIRVQHGVRPDGLAAKTHVRVIDRQENMTRVRCNIETGRTHQIRVHLEHLGVPILGDRLYGVPPQVFLHTLHHGVDEWTREQTGAPRHALHCRKMTLPNPIGGVLSAESPVPEDMERWWNTPACLPHDVN